MQRVRDGTRNRPWAPGLKAQPYAGLGEAGASPRGSARRSLGFPGAGMPAIRSPLRVKPPGESPRLSLLARRCPPKPTRCTVGGDTRSCPLSLGGPPRDLSSEEFRGTDPGSPHRQAVLLQPPYSHPDEKGSSGSRVESARCRFVASLPFAKRTGPRSPNSHSETRILDNSCSVNQQLPLAPLRQPSKRLSVGGRWSARLAVTRFFIVLLK
jgi:hypothetical protein